MNWESFNDLEAQAFMSNTDSTYEGQALVPLHTAYLECAGIMKLCLLPERFFPEFPIDMLCLYRAVFEAFKMMAADSAKAVNDIPEDPRIAHLASAIRFISEEVPSEPRPILFNFIHVIVSGRIVPSGRFDLLFACKLLALSCCRKDILDEIKSGAIRDHIVGTRGNFDKWVDSWTA